MCNDGVFSETAFNCSKIASDSKLALQSSKFKQCSCSVMYAMYAQTCPSLCEWGFGCFVNVCLDCKNSPDCILSNSPVKAMVEFGGGAGLGNLANSLPRSCSMMFHAKSKSMAVGGTFPVSGGAGIKPPWPFEGTN